MGDTLRASQELDYSSHRLKMISLKFFENLLYKEVPLG
jgi:hypothetical protein